MNDNERALRLEIKRFFQGLEKRHSPEAINNALIEVYCMEQNDTMNNTATIGEREFGELPERLKTA